MTSRIFWTLFVVIYLMLSIAQPVSSAAYVAFYTPSILVTSWTIFWFINRTFNAEDVELPNKTILRSTYFSFVSVVGAGFFFSLTLFAMSFLKNEKAVELHGQVRSIRTLYMPFIRNFAFKLVTIEIPDGSTFAVIPKLRSDQQPWIGQRVLIKQLSRDSLTMMSYEFDSLNWHSQILAQWPSAKKSWQEVMSALHRRAQFEALLKWIPRYSKNFGGDDYLIDVGNQYWLKQDLAKTVNFFEAAYQGAPKDYNVLKYYGFYLAKSGKRDAGIALLREATQIQPDNFEAFYQLGHTLLESGKSQEAIPVLERTLLLNPNLSDIKTALNSIQRMPSNDH